MNWTYALAAAIRMERPWGLAALVLLAPVVVFNLRRREDGGGGFPIVLQCLAVVFVAVALSDVRVRMGAAARMPYLVFQDVSASTQGQKKFSDLRRDMNRWGDLPVEVYDFAASVTRGGDAPDRSRTKLVSALQVALARGDGSSGVIIQTDGRFQDSWRPYAKALGEQARDVFVLPMTSPPPDARISDLSARRTSETGVRLELTITSNAMQRRSVRVYRADAPDDALFEKTLNLLMDDVATFRIADGDASADRAVTYRAEFKNADAFWQNDVAEVVLSPGTRRVAIIGLPAPFDNLPARIGATVSRIDPAQAPRDVIAWMDFSAVVLIDPRGDLLDGARRASLGDYVSAGGVLVLLGAGPSAAPADRTDPLNRVAALVANPFRRRKMNVTVVLDASGSMSEATEGGRRKFDRARDAVLALQEHLGAADSLAVVVFSDRPRVVYAGGRGEVDFSVLEQALGKVTPAGPTDVAPALKLAGENPPPAGRQGLVIVVSDLRTRPFDPAEVAALFEPDNLSLAVVAVRSDGEAERGEHLVKLADMLDAEMLTSRTLADLAEIFAGFVQKARGGRVRTGRFDAELVRPGFGIDPDRWRPLEAYIPAAAQENAEVLLRAVGDPVLARRVVGLGRSVTLAIPCDDEVNYHLVGSGALSGFLSSAVRWAMRGESDSRFGAELSSVEGRLDIRVNAEDADGPVNFLNLTAAVSAFGAGAGGVIQSPLEQTAPGSYCGRLSMPGMPAAIEIRDGSGRTVWTGTVARLGGAEYSAIGPEWGNLRLLAELTGGRIVEARELPEVVRSLRRGDYEPIWSWLIGAAVAIMLTDWLINRGAGRPGGPARRRG